MKLSEHGYDPKGALRKWKRAYNNDRKNRHWFDHLPHELAQAVCRAKGFGGYILFGPCGIGCTVSVYFLRDGRVAFTLDLRDPDLETGTMSVIDFGVVTQDYQPESIGAINGLQYPAHPVTPEWDVDDLMLHGEEKNEGIDETDVVFLINRLA